MKRVGLGVALAACAAVDAAEPAGMAPAQSASTPADIAAPVSAPAPAVPNPKPAIQPANRKPLDLRIGDVRKYMMPNEFHAALDAPDAEANTVIVEGKRELLPVQYEKPIPVGPLVPLFWGLMHPTQSWRIFLPDLNRPEEGPREARDKVPPPIFRWGP